MSPIEQQVIETWNIHNRIMLFLIENISDEALSATLSTRGGRDVSRQLAHMYNVRADRLTSFSKKIKQPLPLFDKKASPPKADLLKAFKTSGEVMSQYLQKSIEDEGSVSNFKRGAVPMLGYYISHEAHHRGHMLLTMKQSGHRIPDELKWGIWDWNKI